MDKDQDVQHQGMSRWTASDARCVHNCLTPLLHLCLVSPSIHQAAHLHTRSAPANLRQAQLRDGGVAEVAITACQV